MVNCDLQRLDTIELPKRIELPLPLHVFEIKKKSLNELAGKYHGAGDVCLYVLVYCNIATPLSFLSLFSVLPSSLYHLYIFYCRYQIYLHFKKFILALSLGASSKN